MKQTKYRVIADQLREMCAGLDEGTRLPSEKKLATRYGVSPTTVRQALGVLEDDSFITRIFGKGTFVDGQKRVIGKGDTIASFSEDMRVRGLTPSTRLLGVEIRKAPDAVATDLRLGQKQKTVVIERLRMADGEPMCLETAHLPERFSWTTASDLDGSLHELLESAGVQISSGKRTIRAVALSDRQGTLLRMPTGAPALHIVQVFADEHGTPVQRADAVYRADRYEVYTHIRRP
ncbi:GntR family transcriptional regulator (plasmid) [Arthrobacter sp. zg-Y820]|uniref:GntR family transcriptional regulator n=1 Tax=unclassified Arthrobacter TaxID=235627 RepID=UPI001E5A19A8|nr:MULTISPECIES: GntR family transcriptional regulator [unclassified Arthrobacter]MCC9198525.1 GntR family transcriptional regulator [Arthrobacter sp. zg-Y820]MDK1281395.1 GntR family transcriptional regulator [Arthrobacter sp. zg.Y820]WIB11258.1 GntR family transcriptional regulator [Arthrobacter sp. zg-Y820]